MPKCRCPKCHREVALSDATDRRVLSQRHGYQRFEEEAALKTTLGWQVMAVSQAIHTLLFAVGSIWSVQAFARELSEMWRGLGPLGPGGQLQMLSASTMMSSTVALIFFLLTALMAWGAYAFGGIETIGRSIAIAAQVLIDVPLALWLASRLSGRFDMTIVSASFVCLVSTYLLIGSDEIEISWKRFTVGAVILALAHLVLIVGVITTLV